jgi:hypothetical protein
MRALTPLRYSSPKRPVGLGPRRHHHSSQTATRKKRHCSYLSGGVGVFHCRGKAAVARPGSAGRELTSSWHPYSHSLGEAAGQTDQKYQIDLADCGLCLAGVANLGSVPPMVSSPLPPQLGPQAFLPTRLAAVPLAPARQPYAIRAPPLPVELLVAPRLFARRWFDLARLEKFSCAFYFQRGWPSRWPLPSLRLPIPRPISKRCGRK